MKEYIFSRPDEADDTVKRDANYRGELIRCKDCSFSEMVAPDRCYCEGFLKAWVEEDDFCAWAYPKVKK